MKPNKQITLKEIAKELNVSRATIDRVIHKRGDIGEEMTKRVLDYLKEVNYEPNRVGRSLAKQFEKKCYLIFHDSENEILEDIKFGMMSALDDVKDFGLEVELIVVNKNSEEQIALMRKLADQDANAFAISPYEPEKFGDIVNEMNERGIPVITFNNDVIDSTRLCYIGSNYYKSGRLAGEVLAGHMKKGKIAVLSSNSHYWINQQRLVGFRELVDGYPNIDLIGPYKNMLDADSSYEGMKKIVDSVPDLSGVFILDNGKGVIAGVCKLISEYPDQSINVLTFDLNSECVYWLKRGVITASICQDPFSQGYYSVKLLFNYLFHNKSIRKSTLSTKLDVIYKENMDNYSNQIRQLEWQS